jgi:hypothetical protein
MSQIWVQIFGEGRRKKFSKIRMKRGAFAPGTRGLPPSLRALASNPSCRTTKNWIASGVAFRNHAANQKAVIPGRAQPIFLFQRNGIWAVLDIVPANAGTIVNAPLTNYAGITPLPAQLLVTLENSPSNVAAADQALRHYISINYAPTMSSSSSGLSTWLNHSARLAARRRPRSSSGSFNWRKRLVTSSRAVT